MANRKGRSVSLCLFNHGQIGFPSGNGPKTPPWTGTIRIDLKRLDLPEDVLIKMVENGCRLNDLASNVTDGKLAFETTVDRFAEFVIGPVTGMADDFFNGSCEGVNQSR